MASPTVARLKCDFRTYTTTDLWCAFFSIAITILRGMALCAWSHVRAFPRDVWREVQQRCVNDKYWLEG